MPRPRERERVAEGRVRVVGLKSIHRERARERENTTISSPNLL
jgi:hypothetical protein